MKIYKRLFGKLLDRQDPWFKFLNVGGKMYWVLLIIFFLHIQAYQHLKIFEQKQLEGTDPRYIDFFGPTFFTLAVANGATILLILVISGLIELVRSIRRRMDAPSSSPEAGQ